MAESLDAEPVAGTPPELVASGTPVDTARLPARLFVFIERLLLAAGVVLLVALVWQMGVDAVWQDLRLVGYGFALIFAQEILAYSANTIGWYYAFPTPRPRLPFRRLLAARISGDVINSLTPTATVGGEFVRARLLRHQVEPTSLWASLAVAKVSQTAGQVAFIVVGLFLVLDDTPLPAGVRQALLIGLSVFLAVVALVVVLQRRGMLVPGLNLAGRLGIPVPRRLADTLRRLDEEISRIHSRPLSFPFSVAGFFAGWMAGVIEIYLILVLLDVPGASLHLALTIEVLSVAIDAVFFLVPAKAGTQEGGKVLIFTLLGLPPAKGLALGILRRLRELSWSAVGLAILSRYQLKQGVRG
jgi:putative membrane protein